MNLDIAEVRRQTPGIDHSIHLLAAGSALMPQSVVSSLIDHITLEAQIGGYQAEAKCADQLEAVYHSVARLINATGKEIALVENATVAWCNAFYALDLKPGDKILTCEAEYAANYVAFLHRAKRDGIMIETVPSTVEGELDLTALEASIDAATALIAITWVPTNGGLVNPAQQVGEIAQRHNIPYLLDACQAVGQMPVDVNQLNCDFLSATGRKFLRGPRGTGFLYIREKWLEKLHPPMIDLFAAPWTGRHDYTLRSDARRFENWENAYALRAGLGAAVDYALELGLEEIRTRAWMLADRLRQQLSALPGITVKDIGKTKCAIVSFSIAGLEAPRQLVQQLGSQNIIIGASDPASTRLDSERRQLPVLLRASPHYYNTEQELDEFIKVLSKSYQTP